MYEENIQLRKKGISDLDAPFLYSFQSLSRFVRIPTHDVREIQAVLSRSPGGFYLVALLQTTLCMSNGRQHVYQKKNQEVRNNIRKNSPSVSGSLQCESTGPTNDKYCRNSQQVWFNRKAVMQAKHHCAESWARRKNSKIQLRGLLQMMHGMVCGT